MNSAAEPIRILAVCTGNICRSPMVEYVLRDAAARVGLAVDVRSAGTGDWHEGYPADPRALRALLARGYDAREHRATVVDDDLLGWADIVVALDRGHAQWLRAHGADPVLLRPFDPEADGDQDVPDPFYRSDGDFDEVLGMVERAAEPFLDTIRPPSVPASDVTGVHSL